MNLARRADIPLVLVCAVFLARGFFYCLEQPVWEGYDEWCHFAYIQHVAENGGLPSRSDEISDELRRSLDLVPLSASAARIAGSRLTHDEFWKLPERERLMRARDFEALRSDYRSPDPSPRVLNQYEAQQPPLYYALLAAPYRLVSGFSLPARILVLRVVSLCIAAFALVFAYATARRISAARRMAMLVPVLLVSFSGLYIDVCRVGNDSLAIALGSAILFCSVRLISRESGLRDWIVLGIVLALALLTKAYFIAMIPLLPLLAGIEVFRRRTSVLRTVSLCLLAFVIACAASGWWYWRTWTLTGTLSGEQLDTMAASAGLHSKLTALGNIRWFRVLDTAAVTHIWVGGWSFLGVRSWMYRVFEWSALLALAGLLALATRWSLRFVRSRGLGCSAARCAVLGFAWILAGLVLVYDAVAIFLATGGSLTIGWYSYAVLGAEAVLLVAGFVGLAGIRRAAWCVAAVAILALAFDLYTMHFLLIPYYTGLIDHRPGGALESFHVTILGDIGIREIVARLSQGKGPAGFVLIAFAWAVYLAATGALIAYAASWLPRPLRMRRRALRPAVSTRRAVSPLPTVR